LAFSLAMTAASVTRITQNRTAVLRVAAAGNGDGGRHRRGDSGVFALCHSPARAARHHDNIFSIRKASRQRLFSTFHCCRRRVFITA